ncbi:CDP-alcohol phosphatidyltransferase family protein [Desulforhopalus vacuolatus]|uniref:CDP-alcohol phosphatidyltransferase family protein n=1 Tax=Desulforhopalus vacuolatus TaxID=40414 RepID=UPI00196635F3|nr:CDP-alcohol phosphatidyltransferase family protein [Desulforhopalus vacuolatus]MBM9519113.1 CDP-alcohol phosphatidyltransferase family protein [Desulforhopalus vacuolatus]
MERILIICLSVAIGVGFYYWTTQAIRRPGAKEYVMNHLWFCHPNAICYWRTALALIALPLYFPLHLENLGIMIFTFAAVLDGVDGVVARNCNLVTPQGESLDPLCDKLTYLPAMLAFAYRGQLSIPLVITLIVIEVLGQFGARPMLTLFKISGAANNFGKIKAMICFGLVIFCALRSANPGISNMGDEILVACIVLASASIVFKFVPNRLYADILSTLNFSCGILSLYFASQGHFALAVCVIIAGQLFDLFDGRMAELHGGTQYGPYLDDIADFISFGVAPSYIISRISPQWYGWLVAVIFLGAVAFRLYRFVAVDKKRTDLAPGIFNGLPSPAGALLVLGAALFKIPAGLLVCALISAALMVSHLHFAHFGRIILKSVPKPIFFSLSAGLIIIVAFLIKTRSVNLFGAMILASCLIYLVVGKRHAL